MLRAAYRYHFRCMPRFYRWNPLFRRRCRPFTLIDSANDGGSRLMDSVRMDVWLWAARFFKTRNLAKKACELGRVLWRGQPTKPARDVRVGDMLRVTNEGGDYEIEVLLLSEMRGPAAVAQTLYRETDASRELRLKVAAEKKAMMQWEPAPQGRPSKRDRRRIIKFRGRG
jgi:ribosome-associated heat shock protein Hsp15